MPIIGVIESGVNKDSNVSNNRIAILGTAATIRSNVYVEKINAVKPEVVIFYMSIICPTCGRRLDRRENSNQIADHYLAGMGWNRYCDSGCTHYPLLKTINKSLGEMLIL